MKTLFSSTSQLDFGTFDTHLKALNTSRTVGNQGSFQAVSRSESQYLMFLKAEVLSTIINLSKEFKDSSHLGTLHKYVTQTLPVTHSNKELHASLDALLKTIASGRIFTALTEYKSSLPKRAEMLSQALVFPMVVNDFDRSSKGGFFDKIHTQADLSALKYHLTKKLKATPASENKTDALVIAPAFINSDYATYTALITQRRELAQGHQAELAKQASQHQLKDTFQEKSNTALNRQFARLDFTHKATATTLESEKQKNTKALAEIDSLGTQLSAARISFHTLSGDHEKIKKQLSQKENEIRNLRSASEKSAASLSSKNKTIQQQAGSISTLELTAQTLQAEVSSLKEALEKTEKMMSAQKNIADKLVDSLKHEMAAKAEEMKALIQTKDQHAQTQTKLNGLQEQIQHFKHILGMRDELIGKLTKEKEALTQRVIPLQTKVQVLETEQHRLEATNQALGDEIAHTSTALTKTKGFLRQYVLEKPRTADADFIAQAREACDLEALPEVPVVAPASTSERSSGHNKKKNRK